MGTTLIAFGLSLSHAFGIRGSLASICSVKYDAKYEGTDTPFCACGGDEEETVEHLILYCKGLHQAAEGNGPEFFKALEFMDIQGKKDFRQVEITDTRPIDWQLRSRQG